MISSFALDEVIMSSASSFTATIASGGSWFVSHFKFYHFMGGVYNLNHLFFLPCIDEHLLVPMLGLMLLLCMSKGELADTATIRTSMVTFMGGRALAGSFMWEPSLRNLLLAHEFLLDLIDVSVFGDASMHFPGSPLIHIGVRANAWVDTVHLARVFIITKVVFSIFVLSCVGVADFYR